MKMPTEPGTGVRRALLLTLMMAVCTAGAVIATQPDAWRLFRGNPGLSGVAESGLATELQPLWTFAAGDSIESTAAIADGRVFVGSLDGVFYALSLETGEELWRFETGHAADVSCRAVAATEHNEVGITCEKALHGGLSVI